MGLAERVEQAEPVILPALAALAEPVTPPERVAQAALAIPEAQAALAALADPVIPPARVEPGGPGERVAPAVLIRPIRQTLQTLQTRQIQPIQRTRQIQPTRPIPHQRR